MAASEKTIGYADCGVCGSARAHVRVSARQLAYVVCARCNCQVFARSELSDTLIRSRMRPAEKVPAEVPAEKVQAEVLAEKKEGTRLWWQV